MIRRILSAALSALIAAAAATAQPAVPTSITFAGQNIRLDTPDRYEHMDRELLSFSYMHTSTTLILKRSARYFSIIEPILKANGVPEDLKYLCVIESNLDPQALSRVGAAGLWQFTKATAKDYGLEVREGVDERYNIEKETVAACKFLKKAFSRYGDWMTVAASYNGGIQNMDRKIEQQGQSCALDLWQVEETDRYMYRILAAKMLFQNPSAFGFGHVTERYPLLKTRKTVTVTESIPDLAAFAREHGITYAQLKRANLWLRDTSLNVPAGKSYKILIPAI